jgi:hypothetical protein
MMKGLVVKLQSCRVCVCICHSRDDIQAKSRADHVRTSDALDHALKVKDDDGVYMCWIDFENVTP